MSDQQDTARYNLAAEALVALSSSPTRDHAPRAALEQKEVVPRRYLRYAGVPEAHGLIPGRSPKLPREQAHSPQAAGRTSRECEQLKRPANAQDRRSMTGVQVLSETAFPEGLSMTLVLKNVDAARSCAVDQQSHFTHYWNDDAIPQTDAQRRKYVLRLLLAMRHRENTIFPEDLNRWYAESENDMGGGYGYTQREMELVCWQIEHAVEQYHLKMPKMRHDYNRGVLERLNRDIYLTFEERIQIIIKILWFRKSKCEALLNGGPIEDMVAEPNRVLSEMFLDLDLNEEREFFIDTYHMMLERGQAVEESMEITRYQSTTARSRQEGVRAWDADQGVVMQHREGSSVLTQAHHSESQVIETEPRHDSANNEFFQDLFDHTAAAPIIDKPDRNPRQQA